MDFGYALDSCWGASTFSETRNRLLVGRCCRTSPISRRSSNSALPGSWPHRQPFRHRQLARVGVETEELARAQVQCRGHLQDVQGAMAFPRSVLRRKPLGDYQHLRPVNRGK